MSMVIPPDPLLRKKAAERMVHFAQFSAGDNIVEFRWDRPEPPPWSWAADAKLQAFLAYDFAHTTTLARPLAQVAATKATMASMSIGTRFRTPGGLSMKTTIARANRLVTSANPRPNPRFLVGITQMF